MKRHNDCTERYLMYSPNLDGVGGGLVLAEVDADLDVHLPLSFFLV